MTCKRRTEIAEIRNKSAKNVTFTKRRQGLFKKASELSVLCGVRVGIVTFSPAGKPFLFGEDVIADYLMQSRPSSGSEFDTTVKRIKSAPDGSCETVEELESLIRENESLQQAVARRLESGSFAASSSGSRGAISGFHSCCAMNGEFGSSIQTTKASTLLNRSVPLQYGPESITDPLEPHTAANTPDSMTSGLTEAEVEAWVSTLLNPSVPPLQYGP
ncbi:hypothetical protein CRG98_049994, partial [Punica granatum]